MEPAGAAQASTWGGLFLLSPSIRSSRRSSNFRSRFQKNALTSFARFWLRCMHSLHSLSVVRDGAGPRQQASLGSVGGASSDGRQQHSTSYRARKILPGYIRGGAWSRMI